MRRQPLRMSTPAQTPLDARRREGYNRPGGMAVNEVLQNLYARKSVRLFSERPVQAQTRRQILEAAAQAPTAGNQQLYTIVEITDPQIRETLAQLCDQQWFIARRARWCWFFWRMCKSGTTPL